MHAKIHNKRRRYAPKEALRLQAIMATMNAARSSTFVGLICPIIGNGDGDLVDHAYPSWPQLQHHAALLSSSSLLPQNYSLQALQKQPPPSSSFVGVPATTSSSSPPRVAHGATSGTPHVVWEICRHDVLAGRGARCQRHEGNRMYRELVEHFFDLYRKSSRSQKLEIVSRIIRHIHSRGGKFLMPRRAPTPPTGCLGSLATEGATRHRKLRKMNPVENDSSQHRRVYKSKKDRGQNYDNDNDHESYEGDGCPDDDDNEEGVGGWMPLPDEQCVAIVRQRFRELGRGRGRWRQTKETDNSFDTTKASDAKNNAALETNDANANLSAPCEIETTASAPHEPLDENVNSLNRSFIRVPANRTSAVWEICRHDVLAGRGAKCQRHAGNRLYRNLVQHFSELYRNSSRAKKVEIVSRVIRHVRARGGEFLMPQREAPTNTTQRASTSLGLIVTKGAASQKKKNRKRRREDPKNQQQTSKKKSASDTKSVEKGGENGHQHNQSESDNDDFENEGLGGWLHVPEEQCRTMVRQRFRDLGRGRGRRLNGGATTNDDDTDDNIITCTTKTMPTTNSIANTNISSFNKH